MAERTQDSVRVMDKALPANVPMTGFLHGTCPASRKVQQPSGQRFGPATCDLRVMSVRTTLIVTYAPDPTYA